MQRIVGGLVLAIGQDKVYVVSEFLSEIIYL